MKKRKRKRIKDEKMQPSRPSISNTLSDDGTIAVSELDVFPSSASPRPRYTRNISELSSDSETQARAKHGDSFGMPIYEVEDKSDATRLELNARMMAATQWPEMPTSPRELEAPHRQRTL
jgi:hypothetical protein